MRRKPRATTGDLLTDREAAALLNVGPTHIFELQTREDFPKPLWLGPRCKRHVRGELLGWALQQRERVAA